MRIKVNKTTECLPFKLYKGLNIMSLPSSELIMSGIHFDAYDNDKAFLATDSYSAFVKTGANGEKTIVIKDVEGQQVLRSEDVNTQLRSRVTIEQRVTLLLARAEALYGGAESIPEKERDAYQLALALQTKLHQYASSDLHNQFKNLWSADVREQKLVNLWQGLLRACHAAEIITAEDLQRLSHEPKTTIALSPTDKLSITYLPAYQKDTFVFNTAILNSDQRQIATEASADTHLKSVQLQQSLASSIGEPLHSPVFVSGVSRQEMIGIQFYYGQTEIIAKNRLRSNNRAWVEFHVDESHNMKVQVTAAADLFWDRNSSVASQTLAKLTAACYVRAMKTELRHQLPATLVLATSASNAECQFQRHLVTAFKQLGIEASIAPSIQSTPATVMPITPATSSLTNYRNNWPFSLLSSLHDTSTLNK